MAKSTASTTKPAGSKHRISETPFVPQEGIDPTKVDDERISNWPMVYILHNEDEAYVGQTTSITRRMSQHAKNPDKQRFTSAAIIDNDEFNASVVTDYESRLIQLMSADEKFHLTNGNGGLTTANYFARDEYEQMFYELWADLQAKNLVDHSIDEIEDSELFKYSPYKVLNRDQKFALQKILAAIGEGIDSGEPAPIVVQGIPGTGKTVLAIYLIKMLKASAAYKDLNIKLLIGPVSIRTSIKSVFTKVSGLDKDDVIGPADLRKEKCGFAPGKKGFDVILVDEAHRLRQRKNIQAYGTHDAVARALGLPKESTELDWVLSQAKLPILFYDELQVIGPSGIGKELAATALGPSFANPIRLEEEMRVKGGAAYLKYVRDLLDGNSIQPRDFTGDYDLTLFDDFRDFDRAFNQTLKKHQLTRMVAGYAWKWATKPTGKKNKARPDASFPGFDIEIDGVRKRWNYKNENWVGAGFGNTPEARAHACEVGCIHSIQGYDLSYAFVILGGDIRFDTASQRIVADKSSYWDVNGKKSTTDEELLAYIKNVYYVLLTRGVFGTYLYVCDPALRAHLSHYIKRAGM